MAHSLHNAELIPDSENYEILDMLGRGGMGSVYRGRARATGEQVVLKTLGAELPRFMVHEYEVLRELDHPNIVRAFDLFRMDGQSLLRLNISTVLMRCAR